MSLFSYATLFMDNGHFLKYKEKLVTLANAIFCDYSDRYNIK